MKKTIFIYLFLQLAIAISLTGCGSATNNGNTKDADAKTASDNQVDETIENDNDKNTKYLIPRYKEYDASSGVCKNDSDCVKAECCHAKYCIDKASKQDCRGAMCTLDCKRGTMDCGQGNCICQNGQCAVHMNTVDVPDLSTVLE